MTLEAIYTLQIAALGACIALFAACIYMVFRARFAINGLARSLILLLVLLVALCSLLIVRRLDSLLGLLDDTLLLTSVIVVVACGIAVIITIDVSYLYRQREFYKAFLKARKQKEMLLESMRKEEEQRHLRREWDDEPVKRIL